MQGTTTLRRLCCALGLLLAVSLASAPSASGQLRSPERGFISSEPPATWEEGLICGNGTIGANLVWGFSKDTIVLTHERLFLPTGAPLMPPEIAPRLFEVRRLIDRGLYKQATKLAFDLSEQDGFLYPDPFVPAFDLDVQLEIEGDVTDHAGSVDFQTGEAAVRVAGTRGALERRLFVSREDGMAVLLVTGSGPGSVSCRLGLGPREPRANVDARKVEASRRRFEENILDWKTTADDRGLTLRYGFARAYPGSIHALEAAVRVFAANGTTKAEGDGVVVSGADRVLVLIGLEVLYDPDRSRLDEMKAALDGMPRNYDALLERHARVHGELFNRMRLDLGGGADRSLTTEELLARSTNDEPNRALIEKEFDAGRYNIISSTGELPPTLQGVWAGTYVPDWASDFTHNGNVPSALASMLMGNMPELLRAYTSYIESIVPYLELNARRIFGARGVVLPSRSTTHGFNNAFAENFAGAFWVAGAAWAAHFFYDYYLYTGDREFLASHALPFMEKAAVFFEDYLYEGPDGQYVFSPTQSPENTPGNSNSQGSFNATMDVAAAKELLRDTIAASRELGVHSDRIPVWEAMLRKMPEYLVGPDGAVKEWLTPKLEDRHGHRHSSHLYALYDGMPEEIARSPELQAAFKRVIEIKLERHWGERSSGFMSFGLVQLGQAATSLGESELAYRCLVQLANRYWLQNLASMHNHKSLFNMDISGGMPAVIIKMLVASDPGRIRLLPALPAAWPSGAIEGVLCRGQIEVRSLRWAPDRVVVTLRSAREQTVDLEVGTPRETSPADRRRLSLPEGEDVTLEIELE